MTKNKSDEFYENKITILTQLLHLSEEFISSLDQWESLDGILEQRETLLAQLKTNEDSYGKAVADSCTQEQKEEVDRLINLIISLDHDSANKIREEQKKNIQSIKANVQEQKFIQYGATPAAQSGRLMDYKK